MPELDHSHYLDRIGIDRWQLRSASEVTAEPVSEQAAVHMEQKFDQQNHQFVDEASAAAAPDWSESHPPPIEYEAVTDFGPDHASQAEFNRPSAKPPKSVRRKTPMPAAVLEPEKKSEAELVQRPAAADASGMDWAALRAAVSECKACELCERRKQAVFGVGSETAPLLVVGEGPGADEDRQGEPFVGRAGQLLDRMLAAIGRDRGSNVFIANIVKCRPPQNRDPKAEEAAACSGYLQRQIELIQPKMILALGRVAAQNLLSSDKPLGKLRGQQYAFGDVPLMVTYHPAYLLRSPRDKAKAWSDLKAVRDFLQEAESAASAT